MKKLPKIIIDKTPTYLKIAEGVDFFELFERIETEFDNCFILESLGEQSSLSRYSIIGFDPKHIIRAKNNTLFFDDQKFEVENPYYALREIVPQNALAKLYAGGLVGYLGFDCINYFEPSLNVKTHPDFDQFIFGVFLDGVILDKITGELFYFFYDEDRIDLVKSLVSHTELPLSHSELVSESSNSKILKQVQDDKGRVQDDRGEVQDDKSQVVLTIENRGNSATKEEHAKAVNYVKEQIIAGNTFQCEVGFKTEFKITGNTLQIYKNLRTINPSPFMYYLKFGQQKIIGASPELLFRLRDGEMETYPLAGTTKRGKTPQEDQELAKKLLSDPKEQAEHNMLVDLHRNDIGRVARFGTVKVRNLMDIKKFSHVQHISSEISGLIRPEEDMFSALASNFPAGTLSGAPKIESIKIINKLEKEPRGPYGGAVGHFGFNGDCTFAIAIRSLFISDTYGYAQTSGGVVCDSEPDKEYEEIERKLAAMKEALLLSR